MNLPAVQHAGPLAINMNQPGSFLHWDRTRQARLTRAGACPLA